MHYTITHETAGKLEALMNDMGWETKLEVRESSNGAITEYRVSMINPHELSKAQPGRYAVGMTTRERKLARHRVLGLVEIKIDNRFESWNKAEYRVFTKEPKRIGYAYTTESEKGLLSKMRKLMPLPTKAEAEEANAKAHAAMENLMGLN